MRALATLLLALLAAAYPAVAAPPPDLSADPLDRAALLALPSAYRVDVTLDVPALVTADGERLTLAGAARRVDETGTAFGVAPGGWLATARHVIEPDEEAVARLAYRSHLIHSGRPHSDEVVNEWLQRTQARPVGRRVVAIEVSQADAGDGARMSKTFRRVRVEPSPTADLVLLRIPAQGAPALELDEAASSGTPVVTVGFGHGSALDGDAERLGALEPAIRRGEISRTGSLDDEDPPRAALAISVPSRGGDSGAPVVDADGRVRGVVIRRTRTGGIAERSTELRQLMDAVGVAPTAGRSAEAFREGMRSLWRLDAPGAERAFDAALAAFPDHTLAGRERARAEALAAADIRLDGAERRRDVLLGLGVLAGVIAAGFAAALALPGRGGGGAASGR